MLVACSAQINSQHLPLTDFSQHASSPSNRANCYTELAVSSPAVAETIASTHWTQRVSVLVQCYNAVLLHDTLPATDCTDWWSVPNCV